MQRHLDSQRIRQFELLLDFEEPGEFCAVLEPSKVMVAADRLFIDRVEELVGRGGVRVIN